jgi:cytochrome P450 family 6
MFHLVSGCASNLTKYIEQNAAKGKPLEMKEVAARYSTDVITTCAFGIQSNCLMDPNAEFREFGRQIFQFSIYRSFEFMSAFMLPFAVKVIDPKFFSSNTTKFLKKAFWDTIREREEKNIKRDDILQLLIQLKNEEAKANGVEQCNGVSQGDAREDSFGKLIIRLLLWISGTDQGCGKLTRKLLLWISGTDQGCW